MSKFIVVPSRSTVMSRMIGTLAQYLPEGGAWRGTASAVATRSAAARSRNMVATFRSPGSFL